MDNLKWESTIKVLTLGEREKNIMDAVLESNNIQKEIRSRSIYVPHSFNGGTLKVSFLENSDGLRVFADSYGPFYPDEYFIPSTYRIMILLKESYIGSAEEEKNMIEGHDKANEYKSTCWEDLEPTYKNIAKMAFSLIKGERYSDSPVNREIALSCMRKHVCIVNTNFFPCVGGKESCDKIINDWAKLNMMDIQRQFNLYHPDIVIGGNTLSHFVTDVYAGKECCILGERVSILGHKVIKSQFDLNPGNNDTYYNNHILMINTKHPSVCDSSELLLALRNWWQTIR